MRKVRWPKKGPTTDPACPNRDWHHVGTKCPKCGGTL